MEVEIKVRFLTLPNFPASPFMNFQLMLPFEFAIFSSLFSMYVGLKIPNNVHIMFIIYNEYVTLILLHFSDHHTYKSKSAHEKCPEEAK